jgi:hypothetical protein
MLDHVFTDAIGALREVFEAAMLERQAFEERFQSDFLLGDVTWETTYGLPGEGLPPRVRADITLVWPTWAQTAYRNWYIGESFDEPPRIEIEIVLRVQRLAAPPDPQAMLDALPESSPLIGTEHLLRTGATVETIYGDSLEDPEYAIEVSYDGHYDFDEEALADGTSLDKHFAAMGGWISSTLVRLGDLKYQYRPPEIGPDTD